MVDKRVNKSTKRDKPTITKKALERLVTINNGGPINNIRRSGSEEPESAPSASTLTSRPKDSTPVTTLKPSTQKPNFDFKALMSQSGVGSQLPSFLEQMRAANEELEAERRAGTLASRKIEIDDTSSEGESSNDGEDSGDDDDDDDEVDRELRDGKVKERGNGKEKKDKRERGQYIEMNLGLGVLEEKNSQDETSSSGSSDEDSDEDMGIMDRLEGKDKEEIEKRRKAKIEVVKET